MSVQSKKGESTYVAFLRGINVGGHKKVKMTELKKTLVALGFEQVKTLLASGNVVFTAPKENPDILTAKTEAQLEKSFGFTIGVLIRPIESLQKLAESEPFKGIAVKSETRLYITFLSERHESTLPIPYASEDGNFRILRVTPEEVCSVLTVVPGSRTVDLMAVLEKEFGKKVTTRNWNTILKVLKTAKENEGFLLK